MLTNMKNKRTLSAVAGSALALSFLTAVPAYAADTVLTEVDSAGSLIGVIDDTGSNNDFVLRTTTNASSADAEKLKYRIENPSGAEVHIELINTGNPANLADVPTTGVTKRGTTTTSSGSKATFTDIIVDGTGNAGSKGSDAADNLIGLAINGGTSPVTLTVTAFLDIVSTSEDRIDSVEPIGNPVSITFYPIADITWTTTFAPVAGDAGLSATIAASPAINGAYFDGSDLDVLFTRPGSTAEVRQESMVWDVTNQNFDDNGSAAALDYTANWTGMSNWSDLDQSQGVATTGASFSTSRDDFIATGDVVRVQSARDSGTLTTSRDATVGGIKVGGNDFTIAKTFITGYVTSATARADDAGHVVVMERKMTGNAVVAANKRTTTFTTAAAHGLAAGDIVQIKSTSSTLSTSRITVTEASSSTTFKVSLAADGVAGSTAETGTMRYVSAFEVATGTYTAQVQAAIGSATADTGAAVSNGTLATVSASMDIATTASASIQQARDDNGDDDYGTIKVKAGTTSLDVVATVFNSAGAAVGAGRPVTVETLTAVGTAKVNGKTSSGQVLTTDANGQVALTITSLNGAASDQVTVKLTPEGVDDAHADFIIDWEAQSFGLYEMSSTLSSKITTGSNPDLTRTVLEDGAFTMKMAVLDQWYASPDAGDYRVKVLGQGVNEGFFNLTNGEYTLTVTDNDTYASYDVDLQLQKLSGGVFADVAGVYDLTVNTVGSAKVMVGADGSTLYTSLTADLSDVVSLKALVEKDDRVENVQKPAYTNDLVVTGQIVNNATLAGLNGSPVTITGPSNILFENGAVSSRGSITFMSELDGDFAVTLYSTTAQSATELTISSLGATNTVKVTFTGQTAGEGSVLTIVAPNNVQPSSSFQVTVNLADALGNGVSTGTDGTIRIVRTGPGIAFGALPVDTDANGNASFSILLGANDTGSVTVTASYDQNGDGDYVDTKDRVVTKTITVGGSSSADTKVNAGSFKGYVAVYAKGYEGKRLSAKIGNDWVIVPSLASNFERITDFTGAGVDISVRIYIDRVLTETIPLVTK